MTKTDRWLRRILCTTEVFLLICIALAAADNDWTNAAILLVMSIFVAVPAYFISKNRTQPPVVR